MSVPGSNLLAQALTMIASQAVTYYRDAGRVKNAVGQFVTAFDPGVVVPVGSVQAVPLNRYEALGLDMQKRYVTWFVSLAVLGVARDRSGDEFAYAGRRYGIVGETPWFTQDGWVEVIGIDIGANP